MNRVYRRPARRPLRCGLLPLALLAAGCGFGAGPAPDRSTASNPDRVAAAHPRPFPLATLLASRAQAAIDLDLTSGVLLLRASDGALSSHRPADRRPRPWPGLEGLEALAILPGGDAVLAAERGRGAGKAVRIVRVDARGRRTALPIELAAARRVGDALPGGDLLLAASSRAGSETIYRLDATTTTLERIADYPPGFTVEAISADGIRAALRRALHPEADELYLSDRASGETRLVLPGGADARFLPQAFAPDGRSLLLLSDEADDRLHLAWLDLVTGARRRLDAAGSAAAAAAPPGRGPFCEPFSARLSPDGRRIAARVACDGRQELRLFDAATGDPLDPPRLPEATRAVAALFTAEGDVAVVTVAGERTTRDLLRYLPGAEPAPLTWGLAPGVDPELLASPRATRIPAPPGRTLPAELWTPFAGDRPAEAPHAALLWIEDGAGTPAWGEFHPLFQFLAGHGVAVVRTRLRGSEGFGRRFRRAADGAALAAAEEDIEAAHAEILRLMPALRRLALVAEGAWPAAVATAAAYRASGDPGRPSPARFAAIVAIGADPDPLRRLDELAALSEPAKSWWRRRLGAPGDEGLLSARQRTRADLRIGVEPVVPLLASPGPIDPETLWRFVSEALALEPPSP